MAKCPKCGRRLTIFDWRPNCPGCGVNLVYYGREERLMNEADAAEAEHARLQKKLDRLKASFVGSPLTIVRVILSVLPIAALMLPLCKVAFNGPFIEETAKNINAIEIYNLVSSIDFGALFTMTGSSIVGSAFVAYAVALISVLLSLVIVIVSLVLLTMACGPKGNVRNITLNCLDIALAVVSVIFFNKFAADIHGVFPEFVTGSVQYGAYVYIGTLVLLLAINIIIAKKGVAVKYKQCYVGGIPAEEYFELVAAGTDIDTIHQMMAKAMAEKGYNEEVVAEAAEASEEKEEVNA